MAIPVSAAAECDAKHGWTAKMLAHLTTPACKAYVLELSSPFFRINKKE